MKHMPSLLARICTALILGACVLLSANSATTQADVEKLQDQVRALDKDLGAQKEVMGTKLDALDKRITDMTAMQANHIGMVANLITWISTIITILVFVAGFISFRLKDKAIEEAKATAKKEAQDWFESKEQKLQERIDQLEQRAMDATNHIQTRVDAFHQTADAADQAISERILQQDPKISNEDKQTLEKGNQALKDKPEKEFTAADHFKRGLFEFSNERFEIALDSFDKALETLKIETWSIVALAQYLLAKGLTLYRLKRSEEAIDIFDQIDSLRSSDTISKIQKPAVIHLSESIAGALLNKGAVLGDLNRREEAIEVYDQINQRYSIHASTTIREIVAMALHNKAVTLGTFNRYEEAIVVCNQIEKSYSADTSTTIREQVTKALNAKGFSLLMKAKQCWADIEHRKSNLDQALVSSKNALTRWNAEEKSIVLGNIGYVLFLQGDVIEAEVRTRECLQLGKEKSLETQRADAQQHRIEPEDTQYEAMLTRLWNELKGDSSDKASA